MKNGRIGFFVRPGQTDVLASAVNAALSSGFSYIVAQTGEYYDSAVKSDAIDSSAVDFIVAIGGDGTILRAASVAVRHSLPILGVNTGRIGFLSETDINSLEEVLKNIQQGDYRFEDMLECSVDGGTRRICLNDVMLYKNRFSGVTQISVSVDGYDAGTLFADGVVVATPTGATGYSISAGGPGIAKGIDAAVITPICPHSLTMRPIVTSKDADIRFKMISDGFLSLDGMFCENLESGSEVCVSACDERARFIRLSDKNLFTLIKNKLS